MSGGRKHPRTEDVARWVKIANGEIPASYGGAALSALRTEKRNARCKLAEWDLGLDGEPKVST